MAPSWICACVYESSLRWKPFSVHGQMSAERMRAPACPARRGSPNAPVQPHRSESASPQRKRRPGQPQGTGYAGGPMRPPSPDAPCPPLPEHRSRFIAFSQLRRLAALTPGRPLQPQAGCFGVPLAWRIFDAHWLTLMTGESRGCRVRWGPRHDLPGSDRDSGAKARP